MNTNPEINNRKMQDIAEYLKAELPGHGFALITLEIEDGVNCGSYLSNVKDEFMIKALEQQLDALKKGKTTSLSI